MSKKTVLKVVMIVAVILAIVVLIPTGTASKVNVLGYNSLCSFTPFSSIGLLIIAAMAFLNSKRGTDEE